MSHVLHLEQKSIHSNPIKIPISFLNQNKNHQIFTEPQKALNNQNNPEEKRIKPEVSHYLTSNYTTEIP